MRRAILTLAVIVLTIPSATAQSSSTELIEFFKAYDVAFNSKDMDKLAAFYHPDVTVFEGSGINRGWADYRDNHLGPEMKSFETLQWAHSSVVGHLLGESSAYVTAEYSIKYKARERNVDIGGIATYVLVREQGRWKIRHSHTAARRTPQRGASGQ